MQSVCDLICPECNESFDLAAEMLQHFMEHVRCKQVTKQIPALHPIGAKNGFKIETTSDAEVNPLKFCVVTMNETKEITEEPKKTEDVGEKKSHLRKYECTICSRNFGWSTDLKRHILTHTGERPFRCKVCDSTFTRNFLLQKHRVKVHAGDEHDLDVRIPDLKPIQSGFKQKSRKQEKYKIKRKTLYQSEKERYQFKTNILCTS